MCQVGYFLELYRDAHSPEYIKKKLFTVSCSQMVISFCALL